jgi:hypothetical protein
VWRCREEGTFSASALRKCTPRPPSGTRAKKP